MLNASLDDDRIPAHNGSFFLPKVIVANGAPGPLILDLYPSRGGAVAFCQSDLNGLIALSGITLITSVNAVTPAIAQKIEGNAFARLTFPLL